MDLQLLTLLPFRILLSQQQVTDVTRTWLHGLATAAVAQGRMLRVRASFILVLAAVLATGAWALTAEDSAGLTSLQQSLMNDEQAAAYKWTNGTDPCSGTVWLGVSCSGDRCGLAGRPPKLSGL